MSQQIVFISHQASRTGAPIALLHFLRWLRRNTLHEFSVILKQDGPLRAQFEAVAKTVVFEALDRRVRRNPVQRLLRKTGLAYQADLRHNPLRSLFPDGGIGFIYSNTVTNDDVLSELDHIQCPRLIHVHELESVIRRSGTSFVPRAGRTVHYIAAAQAVARNLRDNHGVSPAAVTIVHESIDVEAVVTRTDARRSIRRELGIPEDAFVVGGSGRGCWRKGQDLFLALAMTMLGHDRIPNLYFLWVGEHMPPAPGPTEQNMADDLKKIAWKDRVKFVGEVSNPYDYYAAFDVLAMVSREDPFPLVNLECGVLGHPIVCFDKAGGTPELVEDDVGFVVPYLDLGAFEDRLTLLAHDAALRRRMGARAAEKVRSRHTVEIAGKDILTVMERMLNAP